MKIGGTRPTEARAENADGAPKKPTLRSRRILWERGKAAASEAASTAPVVRESGVAAREISVIDVVLLAREIASDADGDNAATSREHEDRLVFLRRYAHRPDGLNRRHLIADETTLVRLQALKSEAPNAATVVDIVERAALLSRHSGSPLRVPPMLVVGPPGTGKSRVARRLAEALGTAMTTIDGPMLTDRGPISGHDPGYRGAAPGKVAMALLDGESASPLVLLDEVDKVRGYQGLQPLDALLPLLEPTTAAVFTDSYVSLPMRADGVIWLMTANSLDELPPPLLDRVIVVEMPRLGRAETRDAVARLCAEMLVEHQLPAAALDDAALALLEIHGLREVRRILNLAVGPALAAGRVAPDAADIASAIALIAGPKTRLNADECTRGALRHPVGFVTFPSRRSEGHEDGIRALRGAETAQP